MTRHNLPQRRPSVTIAADWNGHAFTATIGFALDGTPLECFADTAKGGDMGATLADACVLVSLGLQHGLSPATLGKSLARIPAWIDGVETEAPASPVGAIVALIERARG